MAEYSSYAGSKRLAAGDRGYDMGNNEGEEGSYSRPDAKRWRGDEEDARMRTSSWDYQQRRSQSDDSSRHRDGWYERNDDLERHGGRGGDDRYLDRNPSGSGYYGPSAAPLTGKNQDVPQLEDWKCLECKTWNYAGEFRCARCGARSEQSSSSRSDEYHRGDGFERDGRTENAAMAGSEDGVVGQVDEFGRSLTLKEPRPFKKKREWPPSFDEEGSAFVFDSRCAMFYESESDFFYDPKSKLYYGNKQGLYYHYKPESKSFEAVASKSEIASQGFSADPEPILANSTSAGSAGDGGEGKKSISIKIKTKVLKKNDNSDTAKISSSNDVDEPVRKKHAMDIEKWTARTQELKASDAAPAPAKDATGTTAETANQPTAAGSVAPDDSVPRTPKGEPICLLCRRKFPTLEKLKYHVDVSQLHKDNLAKQASRSDSADAPPTSSLDSHPPPQTAPPKSAELATSTEYVDRAQQRRNLYGPELGAVAVGAPPAVPLPTEASGGQGPAVFNGASAATLLAPSSHHHDPLGASSVGHQMLQKLGWTGGTALLPGSKGSRSEAEQRRQQEMHANLQREWDRSSSAAAASSAPGHRR